MNINKTKSNPPAYKLTLRPHKASKTQTNTSSLTSHQIVEDRSPIPSGYANALEQVFTILTGLGITGSVTYVSKNKAILSIPSVGSWVIARYLSPESERSRNEAEWTVVDLEDILKEITSQI